MGLPTNSDLWKSLTMKPPQNMHQLMDWIEEHKKVEDNQNSIRGKTKISTTDQRDSLRGQFSSSRLRKEYYNQASHNFVAPQVVNSVFKEPIYQDRGHTAEDSRTLHAFLDQLVKFGKLKQFLQQSNNQVDRSMIGLHNNVAPLASLGTINVIFAALREEPRLASRIMLVSSQVEGPEGEALSKRPRILDQLIIGFYEDDKLETIQPHDNALVVTLRIAGYDVKWVIIDQGSGAEIMYSDQFKGLGLKPEDLDQYDTPLIGFDGNVTIPKGRIQLLIFTEDKMVNVDFIVVGAFFSYTIILARP
ncbi:uncharacterized protein LOC112006600 [Quercus suber]|uniref:uncharacterized protein LOC112006600 n=1 Tax=Quercus suber TaxID=58331 RepID=UPI000CE1EE22|nr:uncharacterized protein LOC112006600 [Quercus suber]